MLNFELMRSPYNWIIVVLMVMTAGLAVRYIFAAAASSA